MALSWINFYLLKYLAHRASSKVKTSIIEMIFQWSIEFKQEPKIFEAYQMMKTQGIVTEDPVHALKVSFYFYSICILKPIICRITNHQLLHHQDLKMRYLIMKKRLKH